jgi:branched-chain amino acid transport system ATP-binding protein
MTSVRLSDVTAGYGDIAILRNFSMTVESGSVVGVLGPNGAGKTTLLRTLSGLTKITAGEIMLGDKVLTHRSPAEIARAGVAHVPEGRRVFPGMTVIDNLLVGAHENWRSRDDSLAYVYRLFPRLTERSRQRAETLSGGEQQMLAIGRALMMQPKLLMLDEPSQGLSPAMVEAVIERVKQISTEGVTTIIVEQNARALLNVIASAFVLTDGAIVRVIGPDELRTSETLMTILTDFGSRNSTAQAVNDTEKPA